MKASFRPAVLIFLAIVLFTGTGFSQNPPPDTSNRRLIFPLELQGKWRSYRRDFENRDWDRALSDLEALESAATGLGIINVDPLSAAVLQDALKVLDGGDSDLALTLADHATELSTNFPTAYFFRARVIFSNHPSDFLKATTELIHGLLEAGRDIWSILYLVRAGMFWLMVGGAVAYLAFILSVILRYIPRMSHLLEELGKGRLEKPAIYLLVAFLFVGPLWLGLGWVWGLLWWMMLFWVFMRFQERGITVSFVLLIATAGIWLPLWVSTERVKDSSDFITISRAVRGEPGIELESIGDPAPNDEGDGLTALAKGLQFRRLNRLDKAAEQFRIAIRQMPGDERALVGLGNISFFEDKFDVAMNDYKKAVEINPKSVEAHYNLAQASREKLLFEEGEKHYQDAKNLNPDLTEHYTNQTAKEGGLRVVDAPIRLSEALSRALTFRDDAVRRRSDELFTGIWAVSISSAPMIGLLFGAVLVLLSPRAYLRRMAFPCGICGRAICQSCQKHIFHLRVCRQCGIDNKDVKRFSELRQIQQRRDRQMMAARIMTLIAPGSGHLYLMRSVRGVLFIFVFSIAVLSLFRIDVPFAVPYGWMIPGGISGTIFVLSAMAVLYLLAFWDLARIEDLVGGGDIWH
jgi:tetratricopeptide (TPR) repeat protein